MLESYFQEIKRRKRRKLFFWILVFVFATLLYFFFKGKYSSINLNWNNILSQSGNIISETEKSVSGATQKGSFAKNLITFNSFWIVNVKVFPRDSQIYLNHEPYSNDSKPRIDYGDYLLEMQKWILVLLRKKIFILTIFHFWKRQNIRFFRKFRTGELSQLVIIRGSDIHRAECFCIKKILKNQH